MTIPDAPWVRETERTGFCGSGWFNTPPEKDAAIYCERCGGEINVGDEYFDIDGSVLCDDCFDFVTREWRRCHGE